MIPEIDGDKIKAPVLDLEDLESGNYPVGAIAIQSDTGALWTSKPATSTWTRSGEGVNGFGDYNDAATAVTPITLLADTWTTITNDGGGSFTNKTYLPSGVSDLLDTSTGNIDVHEIALGDVILIRNDYEITPSIDNASIEFRYSLGSGEAAYTLPTRRPRLDQGAGVAYREALTIDLIYMGDLNTLTNPITIQVKLSVAGTLKNNGTVISVIKG